MLVKKIIQQRGARRLFLGFPEDGAVSIGPGAHRKSQTSPEADAQPGTGCHGSRAEHQQGASGAQGFPYLLRGLDVTHPHQVWDTNITHIRLPWGMRPRFCVKNCVAIGLASGFIEPLESTSISLMHTGVDKIISLMPDWVLNEERIKKVNESNRMENERIRDFIILHYWANKREGSQFWEDVRNVELPETLSQKLSAYLKNGELRQYEQESFQEPSWLAMYNGFGLVPASNSADAEELQVDKLAALFDHLKNAIKAGVGHAPTQAEFLRTVYE